MKTLRPRGAYAMKNNRGQVLIETALILPLLLLLIFGIVDYGRAMYTKNTLTNAARSGARAAAVTSPLYPTSSASQLSLATGEPATSIQRTLSSEFPQDAEILYEVNIYDGAGSPVTGTVNPGSQVRVTLTYPNFPLITPLYKLMAFFTDNPSKTSGSITISGEASMRYE